MKVQGRFNSGIPFTMLIGSMFLLATSSYAGNLLGLKQVQVNGSQVDVLFDGKVSKNQLRTEFFNDIIQISLTDTAVYPAKISSVNGPILTKIFAYQYAPKLVRCRFTVKGKAESFKDRVKVIPNGKVLTIRFDDAVASADIDKVVVHAAQAARVAEVKTEKKAAAKKPVNGKNGEKSEGVPVQIADPDERSLLQRVLNSDKPVEKTPQGKQAEKTHEKAEKLLIEKVEKPEKASSRPLAGGTSLLSPWQVMGKLGLFVMILLGTLLGFKKLLKGDSALSKLAQKSLKNSLGKKRMIEVLSTHHLGPKKSIAVVKVAGRMMVLGVTNDSINLIAQLNGSASNDIDLSELEDLGLGGIQFESRKPQTNASVSAPVRNQASPEPADLDRKDIFAQFLDSEASKPATYAPAVNHSKFRSNTAPGGANPGTGVRAQIRSRLEGLKQL